MAWSAEWERFAADGKPAPEGLSGPELKTYIAIRGLYYQYRARIIDRDQAKREKSRLLKDLEVAELDERCREKSRMLWRRLDEAVPNCQCPECRAMFNVIHGLK